MHRITNILSALFAPVAFVLAITLLPALAFAADGPVEVPPATWYVALALAIRIAVGAARRAGLPARYGAPVAIVLGAVTAGADVLITGAPWLEAVMACLAAAAAAVASHELGESATGRYAPENPAAEKGGES